MSNEKRKIVFEQGENKVEEIEKIITWEQKEEEVIIRTVNWEGGKPLQAQT